MGLIALVTAGTVQVHDINEEEYQQELEKQKQATGNSEVTELQKASNSDLAFLTNVDPKKLHSA